MKSILFLLQFLDEDPSDGSEVTRHILSIVRLAIKTSAALKSKSEDCFESLDMTMENMEEIWLILCSIRKFECLSYIDKYKYLEKSLLNVYSADYYIEWSQWFLAKSQMKDGAEQEKLFDTWLDCLTNGENNYFSEVFRAIDRMLGAFTKTDQFILHFIDGLIDFCFRQGISSHVVPTHEDLLLFSFRFDFLCYCRRTSSRTECAIP